MPTPPPSPPGEHHHCIEGCDSTSSEDNVFPELQTALPCAYRALKAWERVHVGGEGTPIPEEVVDLIAAGLRAQDQDLEAMLVKSCMGA